MQQKEQRRGDIILCFGREDTVGEGFPNTSDGFVWQANTAPMCFNFKQHLRPMCLLGKAWVKGQFPSYVTL